MAIEAPITAADGWFIGEDKSLTYYVTTGKPIRVREIAIVDDLNIRVDPVEEPISGGDLLRVGELVIQVDAIDVGVGGSVIMLAAALDGNVPANSIMRKVQDITGWHFEWLLKQSPGGDTVLSKTPSISDAANGEISVSIADTDTDALSAKKYYYVLRRTDAGSETVLAYGDCYLRR